MEPKDEVAELFNNEAEDKTEVVTADEYAAARSQFDAMGKELYGDQWESVCAHNVERITGGASTDVKDLSVEQLTKLIKGMCDLKNKRAKLPSANMYAAAQAGNAWNAQA